MILIEVINIKYYPYLLSEYRSKTKEENNKPKKKFIVLMLTFYQVLAEFYKLNRELTLLMYKVFKEYFLQQENRWLNQIITLEDELKISKGFCRSIVDIKNLSAEYLVDEISKAKTNNSLTKGK